MKPSAALFLLAPFMFAAVMVRAGEPTTGNAVDKAAALKAATAWLALLDKPDFVAAAGGLAEEALVAVRSSNPDEKAHVMGAILASIGPTSRMGGKHEMTRRLQPASIKQLTSCGGCGVRDGEYFAFTYDLTNRWTNHHMFQATAGTQELYMLREKDGSWKPLKISYNQTNEKHGGAK